MDTSIVAAIIGLLGAAAVGGLGFILTGIRADIRGLDERITGLDERITGLKESTLAQFGELAQVLARIEATQADHGRQFEKLAGDLS